MTWHIEVLDKKHERSAFDCGEDALNEYLKRLATQHAKRDISKTYVALRKDNPSVEGFYSLSTGSMKLDFLPENIRRKLPKYPIPTAHLGQLAIDQNAQGKGLGKALLIDAMMRTMRIGDELGIYAMTVDAIDNNAARFYAHFGFVSIIDQPLKLYLELKVIRQLF